MSPLEWNEWDRKALVSFLRSQCGRRMVAKLRYLQAQTAVAGCSPRQGENHYVHLAGGVWGMGEAVEAILALANQPAAKPEQEAEELAEV